LETRYDDEGVIASRVLFLDDGDIDAFIFTDGRLSERQKIDGNDDKPWVARREIVSDLG